MATTFSGSIQLSSSAVLTTGYGQLSPSIGATKSFSQGTGDNQFDQVFFKDLTVTGTPTDLDLIGGGLTQPDGTAFAPVEICEMTIINNSIVDTLTIGVGSNPFVSWLGGTTPTLKIMPGGHLHLCAPLAAGYLVTAGSADILRIATSGTSTSVTIQLKGRSA